MSELFSKMKIVLGLIAVDIALICYTITRINEYYSSKEILGDWRGTSGWILICIFLSAYIVKKTKTILAEKKKRTDAKREYLGRDDNK